MHEFVLEHYGRFEPLRPKDLYEQKLGERDRAIKLSRAQTARHLKMIGEQKLLRELHAESEQEKQRSMARREYWRKRLEEEQIQRANEKRESERRKRTSRSKSKSSEKSSDSYEGA